MCADLSFAFGRRRSLRLQIIVNHHNASIGSRRVITTSHISLTLRNRLLLGFFRLLFFRNATLQLVFALQCGECGFALFFDECLFACDDRWHERWFGRLTVERRQQGTAFFCRPLT